MPVQFEDDYREVAVRLLRIKGIHPLQNILKDLLQGVYSFSYIKLISLGYEELFQAAHRLYSKMVFQNNFGAKWCAALYMDS